MKMARIDAQWKELEGEPSFVGWRLLLARPKKGFPLQAALEGGSRRRAILLRVPAEVIPIRKKWPACRGLFVFTENISGHAHCGVSLKDERFADVFTALAEDLARRVSETSSAAEAVGVFFGQLGRWQKFLAASTEGLSPEAQRGLWGELHCLRERLVPILGVEMAVEGWKGGLKAHQDFQFPSGAIEVKTTTAKQPQAIRITSERQLDDSAWTHLFLHVLVLETREGGAATLPTLVESLRSKLVAHQNLREIFEDALLASGYLDAHAGLYSGYGYLARATHWFRVRKKFPRLVESALPSGVGEVNYALSLAACEPYLVTPEHALAELAPESAT
jgi:hypothetical protein